MKSAEEIMNMLEAFDLTGSLRDAGELAGVSHHTVARYVAARPQVIVEYLPKIEEWVERSKGKVRADVTATGHRPAVQDVHPAPTSA